MSDAIIDAVTAAVFRAYFTRDFKYLPDYDNTKTYFLGDQVWYLTNFYQCNQATSLGNLPTDTGFWTAVNLSQANYVLDSDINKARAQAKGFTNPELFDEDAIKENAYLYCTAHYLVMDIRMAEAGLDSRGEGAIASKGVGSVSVSYTLPKAFAEDSTWNYFAQSDYGKKFLSIIIPRVNAFANLAVGQTLP